MSLKGPSWRSAPRHFIYTRSNLPIRTRPLSTTTSKSADEKPPASNPVLEEYQRANPTSPGPQMPTGLTPGDISTSSIFEDERRAGLQRASTTDPSTSTKTTVAGRERIKANMQRVLDPDPNARERWERKKVIQTLRRGGRLNKTLLLKRTEREHLAKSQNMKTSVKKLGKLARQIQGKGLDEAVIQMRFSRKKVAGEVLRHLEAARDEAVVTRGMGLGNVQYVGEDAEEGASGSAVVEGANTDAPVQIQMKDGKRHTVTDRSKIYIDQAWVGRGPYGKLPDFRAKGQVNIMRTPFTSLSLVLKEEGTRVREWEEREAKRRKRRVEGVWVPLPDRPVQQKAQWYSW